MHSFKRLSICLILPILLVLTSCQQVETGLPSQLGDVQEIRTILRPLTVENLDGGFYIHSAGALYHSLDGTEWSQADIDFTNNQSFFTSHGDTLYFTTNYSYDRRVKLHTSTDDGQTWSGKEILKKRAEYSALAVSDTEMIHFITDGMRTSTDGGMAFSPARDDAFVEIEGFEKASKVAAPSPEGAFFIDSKNRVHLFQNHIPYRAKSSGKQTLASYYYARRDTDGNWTGRFLGGIARSRWIVARNLSNPDLLALVAIKRVDGSLNNMQVEFIRSTNGGLDWEKSVVISSSEGSKTDPGLAMDGSNIVVTYNQVHGDESGTQALVSTDKGQSWSREQRVCKTRLKGENGVSVRGDNVIFLTGAKTSSVLVNSKILHARITKL